MTSASAPPASALYVGEVVHARRRPKAHRLRYRVFMLLLDLDEAPGVLARLRLFSRGRFGLLAFDPRSHGDGSGRSLKAQAQERLSDAGIEADGSVQLLTMPTVLGYGFNPLSVYFCRRQDGQLAAVLYEVTNTFGERHTYVVPAAAAPGETIRQSARKRMYVSPFMDMELDYSFVVSPPADTVAIGVTVADAEGPILAAAFAGRRRPLTDAALARAWLSQPLLTLKVISAIHWEALKLWLKGFGLRRRPPPPASAASLGMQHPSGGLN